VRGDRPKVVHPRKLPLWFNVDGLEWRPCEEQSIESERTDLDRRLLAMADSHTADTEEDDRLLPLWGVIHRRHFSWSPRPGETLSVSSGKHQTAEVANAEAREIALAMGYTPPRWRQWWRWGERPLPGQNEPVGA
jgi:hypothetical protein